MITCIAHDPLTFCTVCCSSSHCCFSDASSCALCSRSTFWLSQDFCREARSSSTFWLEDSRANFSLWRRSMMLALSWVWLSKSFLVSSICNKVAFLYIDWNLYKTTTKLCGLSRQVVFHDRDNKHYFVENIPLRNFWCALSKKSTVSLERFNWNIWTNRI